MKAKLRVWTREDRKAQCFRTTKSDGPVWETVERRVTYDKGSGAVLRDDVRGVTDKSVLYAPVPDGPRDIVTMLYYRPPGSAACLSSRCS